MAELTLSHEQARRVYNALGSQLDRAQRFETHAKQRGLALLAPAAGQRVLQIGVGTGVEQAALAAAVGPQGVVVGYDLARALLLLTRQRVDTPLCEGDAVALPFATASIDRLFVAYVLDLLPSCDIPVVLAELRRVLRPNGRLVLVSLTDGVDAHSRLFVAGWKLLYRISPQRLGGCRPLQLRAALERVGFRVQREVIVQRGFPSEVLFAVESSNIAAMRNGV
jgi:ubiquinone/menaquinone biosynthesis C-methylase UbiE